MLIYCPLETTPNETRVTLLPDSVKTLATAGLAVSLPRGFGKTCLIPDSDYEAAGATMTDNADDALAAADIVFGIAAPTPERIARLKPGCLHLSFLDPFNQSSLIQSLAQKNISAVSLEMIPRSTLAQKMDVLSSQANLAGYAAVLLASTRLNKIFPMMMTPSGTLSPARVFIVGVGVAGLQAIATAKRLGARVDAFDTRPVVEEQVKSLGAKFVKIDLGDTGQTAQGYAKELTPEQIEKQRAGMAKVCAQSDVIITTAKLFGRKSPVIITEEMVRGMKPGSVIVDLAASGGGNVALTKPGGEVATENGVTIIGPECLERTLPLHASQMLSANLTNFITHFWNTKEKQLPIDTADPIMGGCLITHGGKVVHPNFAPKTTA